MMYTYHKIDNVYERDIEGSKKLIEGKFRSEAVEFLRDSLWDFTEKIDGTNVRIFWDGYRVTIGGRTDRAQLPNHLLRRLEELFKTPEAEEIFEQKFGLMEVELFGEGYGPKIQNGGAYRDSVDFILFDVMMAGNFQPRSTVEEVGCMFGVDCVPVVLRGTIDNAVAFIKDHPDSTFGSAKMEGVVGRPSVELQDRTGKRVIVKIKARDFE